MGLFKRIIEEHKGKFTNTKMFGRPISELDAESLRACICLLGEQDIQNRKNRQSEREMTNLFRRVGV